MKNIYIYNSQKVGKFIYYVRNIFSKTNMSYPVCVSEGKKCKFFGKFCEGNKWMILLNSQALPEASNKF